MFAQNALNISALVPCIHCMLCSWGLRGLPLFGLLWAIGYKQVRAHYVQSTVTPPLPYSSLIHFCKVVVDCHHSDLSQPPFSFTLPCTSWLKALSHLIKARWVRSELGWSVAEHLKHMQRARSWAFQQGCYSISAEDIASVFWLASERPGNIICWEFFTGCFSIRTGCRLLTRLSDIRYIFPRKSPLSDTGIIFVPEIELNYAVLISKWNFSNVKAMHGEYPLFQVAKDTSFCFNQTNLKTETVSRVEIYSRRAHSLPTASRSGGHQGQRQQILTSATLM